MNLPGVPMGRCDHSFIINNQPNVPTGQRSDAGNRMTNFIVGYSVFRSAGQAGPVFGYFSSSNSISCLALANK
jgi:hypothetical protein